MRTTPVREPLRGKAFAVFLSAGGNWVPTVAVLSMRVSMAVQRKQYRGINDVVRLGSGAMA